MRKDPTHKRQGSLRLCWRILSDAKEFQSRLGLLLLFSLVSIPFAILLPLPLKIIVDYALQQKPIPDFAREALSAWPSLQTPVAMVAMACGLEFLILLAKGMLNFAIWLYQIYVEQLIVADGRARLFRHTQKLSIQVHDQRGIVELFYRLQNDVGSMHALAVNGLIPLASTALTFVIMFFVSFRIDPTLALLALGAFPLTWLISTFHVPAARRDWGEVKRADQQSLGVIQEALGAMRVVRAFSQEEREVRRFQIKAKLKVEKVVAAGAHELFYGFFVTATVATASAAAIYIGARHVQAGILTLGDFLIVTTYLVQLLRPLDYVSRQTSTLQAALVSAERYFNLLEEVPDIRDHSSAKSLARARGKIEFENVAFRYGESCDVFSKVNFAIEPGESVGLVGPTGAGKTTLISLLMRFMDPTEGRILLDDIDLREIQLKDLRRQFAVVLQDPVLFAGTIAENIAYGRPDATSQDIQRAAELAEAHDFIEALPDRYQTQVGERGMGLSGGERQRVSIARAFLTESPVLILDEPTSQLDGLHESAIKRTLEKLKQGRTTFTVSHRLALLENYDQILNMQDGQLTRMPSKKESKDEIRSSFDL